MKRRGFTITEMLIVVGIISLIVTLSVPAVNAIAGNRSIDAAQNQLAAIIGRARQDAIGQQQAYGVLMFQDQNTGRTDVVEVYFPDQVNPMVLGLAPSRDEYLLPTGVSFRMVEAIPSAYTSMSCIMFNGRGEFVVAPWAVLTSPLPVPSFALPQPIASSIALGNRIAHSMPTLPPGMITPISSPLQMTVANPITQAPSTITATVLIDPTQPNSPSAFGFIVFQDEGAYRNDFAANPATTYMNDNGVTFLVSKYTGHLLRSE